MQAAMIGRSFLTIVEIFVSTSMSRLMAVLIFHRWPYYFSSLLTICIDVFNRTCPGFQELSSSRDKRVKSDPWHLHIWIRSFRKSRLPVEVSKINSSHLTSREAVLNDTESVLLQSSIYCILDTGNWIQMETVNSHHIRSTHTDT